MINLSTRKIIRKQKKEVNSTYLVARYLATHKKSYIHDLKRLCKCNNPMQRVLYLRRRHGWKIETIHEGTCNGVAVYHYKVIKKGTTPQKYN